MKLRTKRSMGLGRRMIVLTLVACMAFFQAIPGSAADDVGERAGTSIDSAVAAEFLESMGLPISEVQIQEFFGSSTDDRRAALRSLGVNVRRFDRLMEQGNYASAVHLLGSALLTSGFIPERAPLGVEGSGLPTQQQLDSALAGQFKVAVTELIGDRLGIVGWADDGSSFVVRVADLSPRDERQVKRLVRQEFPALTVTVESTPLSRAELHELRDVLEGEIPDELTGWDVGIDLDAAAISMNFHPGSAQESVSDREALIEATQQRQAVAAGAFVRSRAVPARTGVTDAIRGANGFLPESPAAIEAAVVDVVLLTGDGDAQVVDWRETAFIRGGEYLRNPDGGRCTSGFRFRKYSNGSTHYRMSMAGHCADGGDWTGNVGGTVRHVKFDGTNGDTIGTVSHNTFRDEGVDVALFRIPSNATSVNRVTTTANTYRDYVGERTKAEMNHNDTQCFVGLGIRINDGLNKKCGPLKKEGISWSPSDAPDGYTLRNFWCLERRTIPGDSGGPIYYEVGSGFEGAGTMVWSKKETPLFSTTKWFACYSVISDIEAATGYTFTK